MSNPDQRPSARGTNFSLVVPWSTEFFYVHSIACMLAFEASGSRDRLPVEVGLPVFLGGVFIAAFERIDRYWSEPGQFEDLVRARVRLDRPRWVYQAEFFEQRKTRKLEGLWPMDKFLHLLIKEAQRPAQERFDQGGRERVLTTEDFLDAMTRHPENDLCRELNESGLDLARLAQGVHDGAGALPL